MKAEKRKKAKDKAASKDVLAFKIEVVDSNLSAHQFNYHGENYVDLSIPIFQKATALMSMWLIRFPYRLINSG